jgi:hypothetical protein
MNSGDIISQYDWYTTSTFPCETKTNNMNFLKELLSIYSNGLAVIAVLFASAPLILALAFVLGYVVKFTVKIFMYAFI